MTAAETYTVRVHNDLLAQFKGLAAQSGPWKGPLFELFDNGFDAAADSIVVTFRTDGKRGERQFTIQDNGNGCDELALFFGLGKRRQTKSTIVGQHGWGAKHALLWIAHDVDVNVRIESVHGRMLFGCTSTFQQIGQDEELQATKRAAEPGQRGTKITLTGIRRPHVPAGKDEIGRLKREIGFVYSRALEDGKTILIHEISKTKRQSHVVEAYQPPAFERQVSEEFELSPGKRVRLHVGAVAQGADNEKSGLHYRYGYRVIEACSGKGCEGYSTSRVFGYVDLIGSWRLATLKDEVHDTEELHAAIRQRLEGLLQHAQAQVMVAESAELIAAVEDQLNDAIGRAGANAKARRGKGSTKGVKRPTGKGGKHKRARNEQEGQTFRARGTAGRVSISFARLSTDSPGDFQGNDVRLNTNVDAIVRARAEGNRDAIFQAAMWVYAIHATTDGTFDQTGMTRVLEKVGRALCNGRIDGHNLAESAAE